MSINHLTRQKLETTYDRRYYKIVNYELDPYWDEGLSFYPTPSKMTRKWKKKRILSYQVRMYRTWKHNRVHQWKEIKERPSLYGEEVQDNTV